MSSHLVIVGHTGQIYLIKRKAPSISLLNKTLAESVACLQYIQGSRLTVCQVAKDK